MDFRHRKFIAMRGGNMGSGFLTGIERTLTACAARWFSGCSCAAMMAILSFARLPRRRVLLSGRDVCLAAAARGFVQAALRALCWGFAAQHAAGALAGRWQLPPVCTMLWLSSGALGETGQSDDDGGGGFSDPVDGRGGDGR